MELNKLMVADIAVIGAGITGLICAKQLQQAGYRVVVLEKSRGLGGRVATRRLEGTWADHGVRYLTPQGELSQQLIQALSNRGIVRLWTEQLYENVETQMIPLEPQPCYVASDGITAIAKYLATGLEIQRNQRVVGMIPQAHGWSLSLESTDTPLEPVQARAVVITIPAPQAVMLLESLSAELPNQFLVNLRSVQFDPCLSAIATYPSTPHAELVNLPWRGVFFRDHPDLGWVGLESSKQFTAQRPVLVVQSSAAFATQHLETSDLQPIGRHLLTQAAKHLIPWFDTPDTLQVHRWRYAFTHSPLSAQFLSTTNPQPLVCGGDWCQGNNLESALKAGLVTASAINQPLDQRSIPNLQI